MDLTEKEIGMLASVERDMDSGKQAFVLHDGGRWAFPQELLDECGVENGQNVTNVIIQTLMRMNIASMESKMAIEKAMVRGQHE